MQSISIQKRRTYPVKKEGGEWGMRNVPKKYQTLIVQALDEYLSNKSTEWNENNAHEYAAYMVTQISN